MGLINELIRPSMVLLTLPATLLTMSLFIFFINALMFWTAVELINGFHVAGFYGPPSLGAILYSIISWVLSSLLLQAK